MIETTDWVIDLGYKSSRASGLIIAEGTPEEMAAVKESYTGVFLKPMLTQGIKDVS